MRTLNGIALWSQLKKQAVYFLTRMKSNASITKCGDLEYDATDPINTGILFDRQIGIAGVMVRHVRYQCPRSGEIFDFLTNERTIPPGLLARIYQMRWDIEPERSGDSWPSYFEISQQKTYDEFKNKLNEKKAWVSSPTAKAMQAWFICLAHNLMVLQEHLLRTGEGVTNTIGVPALQKILK